MALTTKEFLTRLKDYVGDNPYLNTLKSLVKKETELSFTQLLLGKQMMMTHAIKTDDKTILEEKIKEFKIDWTKYNIRPPFPFQRVGINWLLNKNKGILGDEQGLGKSIQAIIAALELGAERILIVCPNSLKLNWAKEIIPFNKEVSVIHKDWSPKRFTIINYEGLKKHFDKIIKHKFELVIADECFPYETLVTTKQGQLPIGYIVENNLNLEVLSYNLQTKETEWKPINRWVKKETGVMLKIKLPNDIYIHCTPNHKIYINEKGYVRADEVRPGDQVLVLQENLNKKVEKKDRDILFPTVLTEAQDTPAKVLQRMQYSFSEEERSLFNVLQRDLCWDIQKEANTLKTSESSLSTVRKGVSEATIQYEKILYNKLCCKMEDETVRDNSKNKTKTNTREEVRSFKNDAQETSSLEVGFYRTNKKLRPSNKTSWCRKNEKETSRKNFFSKRWKQEVNQTTNNNSQTIRRRMGYGIFNSHKTSKRGFTITTTSVQSGPRTPVVENSNRGRWDDSQTQKVEILRQKEDNNLRSTGVESVEVLELGYRRGPKLNNTKNTRVYNLEIANNHNYFANNILVSNCHLVKNSKAARTKTFNKVATKSKRVWLLTGTPIANKPIDFYNLLKICKHALGKNKQSYGQTFCLPEDAPVLMADFTEKQIKDICIGEEVIGWSKPGIVGVNNKLVKAKVLNTLTKKSSLQKVTLSNGDVITCTPDHKWWNPNDFQNPYKVLGTKKTWRSIPDRLAYIYRSKETLVEDDDYRFGYLIGALRGDGHMSRKLSYKEQPFKTVPTTKPARQSQIIAFASKDKAIINRIESYLNYFGFTWSSNFYKGCERLVLYNTDTEKNWIFFQQPFNKNTSGWKGFMAGIYDAEGCREGISQSKLINLSTFELICEGFSFLGFKYRVSSTSIPYRIKHNINSCENIFILGGKKETLRFFDLVKPALLRKLESIITKQYNSFLAERPTVISIEQILGEHLTYTLTTETGNYIAYGYGSKNCGGQMTHWGFDYNGASNLKELFYKTQDVILRRRKDDVLDLPGKIQTPIYLEFDSKQRKLYESAVANYYEQKYADELGDIDYDNIKGEAFVELAVYRKFTAIQKIKDGSTLELINNTLEQGDKVIVFTNYLDVIDSLALELKDNCLTLDGRVDLAERQRRIDLFQTGKGPQVMICNFAVGAFGTTLTKASVTIMNDLSWSPSVMQQAEDRNFRIGQTKKVNILYPVYDDSIDVVIFDVLKTKIKNIGDAIEGKEIEGFNGSVEKEILDRLNKLKTIKENVVEPK